MLLFVALSRLISSLVAAHIVSVTMALVDGDEVPGHASGKFVFLLGLFLDIPQPLECLCIDGEEGMVLGIFELC